MKETLRYFLFLDETGDHGLGFVDKIILDESDYCLLGSGIQKDKLIKKYGKGAKDPYTLSLSFIVERLIFYLDSLGEKTHVRILAEERGKKEDQMLLSHFYREKDLPQ